MDYSEVETGATMFSSIEPLIHFTSQNIKKRKNGWIVCIWRKLRGNLDSLFPRNIATEHKVQPTLALVPNKP